MAGDFCDPFRRIEWPGWSGVGETTVELFRKSEVIVIVSQRRISVTFLVIWLSFC